MRPSRLRLIGGKPMIVHTLEKMERVPEIKRVVIPCAPETHEKTQYVLDAWGFDPKTHVLVEGGATRQQSVLNGLLALDGFDYVLIHEAARPFASVADYRALLDCEHENALLGAPIPFTVAKVGENGFLDGALERSEARERPGSRRSSSGSPSLRRTARPPKRALSTPRTRRCCSTSSASPPPLCRGARSTSR